MAEGIGEKGARSLRNSKMLKHLIHSASGQMLRQKMSERKKKLDHFFRHEYKPFSFTKYARLSSCNV
jgi:hypothetical protein